MYDHLPVIDNPLDERTAYLMSPITLAFVGDAVQQLLVKPLSPPRRTRKTANCISWPFWK